MLKTLTAAAAFLAIAGTAQAQSYTTMPLGGGMYSTTGPGGTYTTIPLGGGMSTTTGPNGYRATTIPLDGGMSTTTVSPPMMAPLIRVPSTPLFQPYGYR